MPLQSVLLWKSWSLYEMGIRLHFNKYCQNNVTANMIIKNKKGSENNVPGFSHVDDKNEKKVYCLSNEVIFLWYLYVHVMETCWHFFFLCRSIIPNALRLNVHWEWFNLFLWMLFVDILFHYFVYTCNICSKKSVHRTESLSTWTKGDQQMKLL